MEQTQDEFLKEFEPKEGETQLEQPLFPEKGEEKTEEEELPEDLKNRHLRRLEKKLQMERESGIALAARLETLSEAQRFRQEMPEGEYLKTVERIYGTNSPEAIEATELLKQSLRDVKNAARDEALETFREEQRRERGAVQQEEQNLDGMIEELEDEYRTAMNENTKRGFFQLLEKMSPKDREGNIIAYADHHAVWEELQTKKQSTNTRAKDLASRSMVQTGASPSSGVEVDANERYLKEQGII